METRNFIPESIAKPVSVESRRINLPQFDNILPELNPMEMDLLAELTIRKQKVKN
jgi:hypothetical protein